MQWTREQEHAWEPYGPAMLIKLEAALDDGGGIVDWDHEVWSNTHSTRPGPAGSLLAARYLDKPFPGAAAEANSDAGRRRRSQFHSYL